MGSLPITNPDWPGLQDTRVDLVDGVTPPIAAHINTTTKLLEKIEIELGLGVKGSTTSLTARLQRAISQSGGLPSGTAFPVSPAPADGDCFWRGDEKRLYVRDGTAGTWIALATASFAVTHSTLAGLANDDHAQYLLTTGARDITSNQRFLQDILLRSGTAFDLTLGHNNTAPKSVNFPDDSGTVPLIDTTTNELSSRNAAVVSVPVTGQTSTNFLVRTATMNVKPGDKILVNAQIFSSSTNSTDYWVEPSPSITAGVRLFNTGFGNALPGTAPFGGGGAYEKIMAVTAPSGGSFNHRQNMFGIYSVTSPGTVGFDFRGADSVAALIQPNAAGLYALVLKL